MSSKVYFHSLEQRVENDLTPLDLGEGLRRLAANLKITGAAGGPWGMKVQLGPAGLPASIMPAWAQAVAGQLPGGAFCFDTLSITTRGLEEPASHLEIAGKKGFGGDGTAIPFRVADAPDQGPSESRELPGGEGHSAYGLAGGLRAAAGLAVLTPLRPHPHLGFAGALATAGLGLADRATKIRLHRDIRPKVDTPLCAGCGSCLDVCLFDAIVFEAGRAAIDHTRCTGCGECMNVCFMAGISDAEGAGIPNFQRGVAAAAAAGISAFAGVGRPGPVFFNFLLRLGRQAAGPQNRKTVRVGDIGVLASRDPVALDRAAWDLVCDRQGGDLSLWSGFKQEPGILLAEAERLGLGSSSHDLIEV